MNDTMPNIAALVRERLLSRSGTERVVMGSRMFDGARTIALASFPPSLSEIETKRRLCERLMATRLTLRLTSKTSLLKLTVPKGASQSDAHARELSGVRGGGP